MDIRRKIKEKGEMTLKKIGILSLTLMLLASFIAVFPMTHAANANSIWVDPSTFNATTEGLGVGDTFTISVWINITAQLYGLEYKLKWNDTLIKHVSHTLYIPWSPFFTAKDVATAGQYWFAASALAPALAYSGLMKVLDITFLVDYQPYYPEPVTSCALDLADTKMGDPLANPILHIAYDGLYEIDPVTPEPPSLKVDPALVNARTIPLDVGDQFTVDIDIMNLAAAWDLMGWETKLSYDSTLLSVVNVQEGPFLKAFNGTSGTFFIYTDRPLDNYVVMAGLFLGNHTKPYGSGRLANVTFEILYESPYPTQVECDLHMYDVKLVSSLMEPIAYTITQQGHYIAPMSTALGAAIDVYTGPWRWPNYTTIWIGLDPNTPADAYSPQEYACFYTKLTYGGAPVQLKEVAWEITAPNGEIYYRQSMTDMNGTTMICMRMPWWEGYFGNWSVLSKANVAGFYVNDTVTFLLGYIVYVTESVTETPVNRGEVVEVNLTLNNIGNIPRDVFISITIYDDVGMPIATVGSLETALPGTHGPYVFHLLLAEWAHVGQGTVFINLFTGVPPSQCGVCYAPEHVQTFQITWMP